MRINVAYDISNLAADYGRSDAITGINRVVNEMLEELSKRDDLAMTAVALEGDDPLDDCTKAALYLEHRKPAVACAFEYTFDPGRRLTTAYKAVLQATRAAAFDLVPMNQPRTLALRYARSALHRLAYYRRVVSPKPVLHRKRFDVFHCPHWKLPPTELMSGLPRVFTVYDLIPLVRPEFVDEYLPVAFQRQLNRMDIEKDWVLCISEFTRQEFCDRTGMSPDRVRVSPLAAADFFRPVTDPDVIAATRARYRVPEGQYLLCLAAPQPRKNVAHLIRSFFRLLDEQRQPDTHLVLAGSAGQGWMYDEIFAAAKTSSSHRSRFTYTGYVAEEDLAALYSGAAAFVFPSLYEGFGLPALEAMACGTPVITSNTTSLPEVVGDAALLVDPTDPDELCDAMSRILSEHSLREELRKRGLKRAAEFSWTKCADLTAGVYHLAADGRAATTGA
jgi:glycosyltransferase involved in cell wall biosynthesis